VGSHSTGSCTELLLGSQFYAISKNFSLFYHWKNPNKYWLAHFTIFALLVLNCMLESSFFTPMSCMISLMAAGQVGTTADGSP